MHDEGDGMRTHPVLLAMRERALIRQMIRSYVRSNPLTDQEHRVLLAAYEKLWATPTQERLAIQDEAVAA
jgi:hypothetical protein